MPDLQSTNAGSGPFMNVSRFTETKPGSSASAIRWCFVGSLLALLAALSTSLLPAGSFTSAVETIHKRELRQHCAVLASDTLEGRETWTPRRRGRGSHDRRRAPKTEARVRRRRLTVITSNPFPPNSRNILRGIASAATAALKSEYVVVGRALRPCRLWQFAQQPGADRLHSQRGRRQRQRHVRRPAGTDRRVLLAGRRAEAFDPVHLLEAVRRTACWDHSTRSRIRPRCHWIAFAWPSTST